MEAVKYHPTTNFLRSTHLSILCHLVIANVDDVENIRDNFRSKKYFWTAVFALDEPERLATLLRALRGTKRKVSAKTACPLISDPASENPWVYKIADELVERLSQIEQSDIPSISKDWADIDEVVEEWGFDIAKSYVLGLRTNSKKAIRAKKSLLLRINL